MLLCAFLHASLFSLAVGDDAIYSVGVAEVDITPDYPIRMNGFLNRKQESVGVRQRVWAKALAIGKDDTTSVVITVDTLGIPEAITEEIEKRLNEKAKLPKGHLSITASHSHTAPMINGCAPNIFGEPIPAADQAHIDRYTTEFTDHLESVALAALKDQQPAKLQWGIGLVSFAKNRRDKNGPIDHDLPMLVVRDLQNEIRAIYVSYACHCVTLSEPQLGGDWAGYTQEQIERRYPKAIAMVSIGCAGDQNPLSGVMNDRADLAQAQGEEIAVEVDRLLKTPLRTISGSLKIQNAEVTLPLATLPTRAQFEELAKKNTPPGYHARVQLAKLDRGEKLRESIRYPIQTWTLGDALAMVFLPGEVVSEYGLRIKSELDGLKVWVNAYANACPCYIPSEKVLAAGGYEGASAMIYYDQPTKFAPGLEQIIIDCVVAQLGKSFPPALEPGKGQGTRPRAPEQSLKMMRTASELQVELVAAEPLVTSPVAVSFGPDGKVWVAEMFDYPSGLTGNMEPAGRVRVLSSSKDDGHFDQSTVFLSGIPFPTGITVWREGVLVCAAPDILYAVDRDGDGRADEVKKLFSGFGTDNYQARVNSLEYGLDGWVYGSCGLFGGSIKSFDAAKSIQLGDRDFRIQPDTGVIEPATGRTQQGRVRDDFDQWFGSNNSTFCFHYPLMDHDLRRNPNAPPAAATSIVATTPETQRVIPASDTLQLFKLSGGSGKATAACGIGIYRDHQLGDEYYGNAYTCEPVNCAVHRLILKPNDSTFVGERAAQESDREFLASTDTWFRPVQARTAPDGSLWILDMYRFVIEHPRWIPPESLAQVDTRAGSTLGRIYRVKHRDSNLTWPQLDNKSAEDLVAALDSSNGWQRDMAMQLLLWNHRDQAARLSTSIRQLARSAKDPAVRVQALSTLGALSQLTVDDLTAGIEDSAPSVRKQSLRWTSELAREQTAKGQGESERDSATKSQSNSAWMAGLLPKIIEQCKDADPQVRLHAAVALGDCNDNTAASAKALASLAIAHPNDRYLQAAILSSLSPSNANAFAEELMEKSLSSGAAKAGSLMIKVMPVAYASAKPDEATKIFTQFLTSLREPALAPWQLSTAAALLERFDQRHRNDESKENPIGDDSHDANIQASLDSLMNRSRELLKDSASSEAQRLAALELLNRRAQHRKADREVIRELLTPQNSVALQLAAVRTLFRNVDDDAVAVVLEPWKSLSPQVKTSALDSLLSRPSWTEALVDALEKKTIDPSELDATRRQQLLTYPVVAVRKRAEKQLSGKTNPDRIAVLENYATVNELQGDAERGKVLFTKQCASCHRLGTIGTAVGPDLAALGNKPVSFYLQEILDPNRNLDSRYISYTALTESGRTISGLLAAESSTAVTLRGAEGKEETLQRAELEQLLATRNSLMPEGLERLLPHQDMADVITFVRAGATTQTTETPAAGSMAAGELARELLKHTVEAKEREKLIPAALPIASEVITAMVAGMPDDEKEIYRRIPWIWRVAIAAGKSKNNETIKRVLECSLPRDVTQPLQDWQAVVIGGGLINGLSLGGQRPRSTIEAMIGDSEGLKKRWQHALQEAVRMTDNKKVRTGTRYDALRMIAMLDWDQCREQLERYSQDSNAELKQGALAGLKDVEPQPQKNTKTTKVKE